MKLSGCTENTRKTQKHITDGNYCNNPLSVVFEVQFFKSFHQLFAQHFPA